MRSARRSRAFLAAAALAAAAAGGCVSVEVTGSEVSSVCVVDVALDFEPSAATTVTTDVSIDAGASGVDVPDVGAVVLDSAVFFAGPGIDDFGFVDSIALEIRPDLVLADEAIDAPGSPLFLRGRPDTDIAPALRGGEVVLRVAVTGDLPDAAWAVTVDLCFDVDDVGASP